jgi:integrase
VGVRGPEARDLGLHRARERAAAAPPGLPLTRGGAGELDALKEKTRNPAPTPRPQLTLARAFERYFQAKARKRSLEEDRRISVHLTAELGADTLLSALTASRISEYKASRPAIAAFKRGTPLSAASINRPLALLRHLLRLAHEQWEVLDAVPAVHLEREPEGRVVWLEPDAERVLLDAYRASRNPDLYALVLLAIETGMRQGEILGLEWSRIDMSRGVIVLSSRSTKSKRRRETPCGRPSTTCWRLARGAWATSSPAGTGRATAHGLRDRRRPRPDGPRGRAADLPRPTSPVRLVVHDAG